jgi:hypothetical protein
MFLKKKLYLFGFLSLFLFNACILDDNRIEEIVATDDATIILFALSSDSIPELATINFTIDQYSNKIYNKDSMSYGTVIERKVIITYTSGAQVNNMLIRGVEDSTWVASGDSIDISQPLNLRVYAIDNRTTKDYTFQLNIHKIDPDSVRYERIASNLDFIQSDNQKSIYFESAFYTYTMNKAQIALYSSKNAISWSPENLSGLPDNTEISSIFSNGRKIYSRTENGDLYVSSDAKSWAKIGTDYPVVGILGYLNQGALQNEGLCTIMSKNSTFVFAFSSDLSNWTYGDPVPEAFPFSGFSGINQEVSRIQQFTIFGGTTRSGGIINACWATQNGLHWAKITDDRFSNFPHITGANAFIYDDRICLINGRSSISEYNKKFYVSEDNGYTWFVQPDKYNPPLSYVPRFGASLVVDEDGVYFYILGSQRAEARAEVWKGFQNKKLK